MFDPGTYNVLQCVGGSVWSRNKKCSTGLAFNTAKHPLALNRVSPMVFSPTELSLVDLNGLFRTTELLIAVFLVNQHSLPAEHIAVRDRVITTAGVILNLTAN